MSTEPKCCKRLTAGLSPLDVTYKKLTKNRGGTSFKPKVFSLRGPPRFVSPFVPPTLPPCFPISYLPYTLPTSVSRKSYLPLLRKLPGVSQQFPFRNSSPRRALLTSLLLCFIASRFPALIDTRPEAAYLSAPLESFAQRR